MASACPYDRLLLATGAVPRRLPLPGTDAGGMLYLRRVGDSDRIVNIWDVNNAIGDLVRSGRAVDPARLADPAVPLEEAVAR
jgi:NADPH-dependent 2,4-dienoyl-CoA reductase/sulfur reductase-like enzyme